MAKKLFYTIALILPQITLAVTFTNPLQSQSFEDLVINVSKLIRQVAIPFAAVAIIVVGFKLVTSIASGNAEDAVKSRKILVWVLVGAAVIAGATYLAEAIVNFARSL